MKIVSFVYCENVDTSPDGKNIIMAPMQMFTPVGLPSNYSFTVSFGIFDFPATKKKQFKSSF